MCYLVFVCVSLSLSNFVCRCFQIGVECAVQVHIVLNIISHNALHVGVQYHGCILNVEECFMN